MGGFYENTDKDIEVTDVKNDAPRVWDSAPAHKLVGLCAIRRKPIEYSKKTKDHSFSSEGMYIREVTQHGHILRITEFLNDYRTDALDPRWNDDGWVRAPNYMCEDVFKFLKRVKDVKKDK